MTSSVDTVMPQGPAERPPVPSRSEAEIARFNTWLGQPAHCHRKSCQRAGRCLGMPLRCLQDHWRRRTDIAKIWMEGAHRARDAGRTERAAARAGDEAVAAWVRRNAGLPAPPPRRR